MNGAPMRPKTDPAEFEKFHNALESGMPPGYVPHYQVIRAHSSKQMDVTGPLEAENRKSPEQVHGFLAQGYNCALYALEDDCLAILDDDVGGTAYPDVVPTLKVRTRGGGNHYFYQIDPADAHRFLNTDKIYVDDKGNPADKMTGKHIGELRARNQYVIVAGSYVKGDDGIEGGYTVVDSRPPVRISYAQLPLVVRQWLERDKASFTDWVKREQRNRRTARTPRRKRNRESRFWQIELGDVLGPGFAIGRGHRAAHPYHYSKTKKDVSIGETESGDVGLICWGHGRITSPLLLLYQRMLWEKSGKNRDDGGPADDYCMRFGWGMRNHADPDHVPEVDFCLDVAQTEELWAYAKKLQLIPENDPHPLRTWGRPEDYFEIEVTSKTCRDCGGDMTIEGKPCVCGGKKRKYKKYTFLWSKFANDMTSLEQFIYHRERGHRLFVKVDNIYRDYGEDYIRILLKNTLRTMSNKVAYNHLKELLEQARTTGVSVGAQDDNYHLIPMKNGVYDIETGFRPYRDEDVFFSRIEWDYIKGANKEEWPTIDAFLKTIFPEDWHDKILRFFAACLLREQVKDAHLMLIGPTNSAKTTFMKFAAQVIGVESTSTVNILRLSPSYRFEAVQIKDKHLNICDDIVSHKNKPINVGAFKSLTGGGTISGEKKGKDPEDITSYAQWIMGSNDPPYIDDTSGAYDARVQNIIMGQRFFEKLPENPMKNWHQRDSQILMKMEKEIPAFLSHVLTLVQHVHLHGLLPPMSVEENQTERMRTSNPQLAFLNECCEISPGYLTYHKDFLNDLLKWCATESLDASGINLNSVSRSMTTWKPEVERYQPHGDKRCWLNLKVKKEFRCGTREDPPPVKPVKGKQLKVV